MSIGDTELTATVTEIVAVNFANRHGLDVTHFSDGSLGLVVIRRVTAQAQANDWSPVDGWLLRTTVYLSPAERNMLAGELMVG